MTPILGCFNTTFRRISALSCQPVLMVEEAGVPTMGKQLIKFITCGCESSASFFVIYTQWVKWLDYLATHTSLSPIRREFTPGFVNYKKGCTRLAAASDKFYQLLAHGQWFLLENMYMIYSMDGKSMLLIKWFWKSCVQTVNLFWKLQISCV
jgi:hypothetical protein